MEVKQGIDFEGLATSFLGERTMKRGGLAGRLGEVGNLGDDNWLFRLRLSTSKIT